MIFNLFGIGNKAIRSARLNSTLRDSIIYAAAYIALHCDIQSQEDLMEAIQKVSILILEDSNAYLTFDEMEPPIACIITPEFTLRPTPTSNNYAAWFSLDEAYETFPSILIEFSKLCGKMAARRELASIRTPLPVALRNETIDKDSRNIAREIAIYFDYTYA